MITLLLSYVLSSYVVWYFWKVKNDSGVPFGRMFWIFAPIALPLAVLFFIVEKLRYFKF
jgi:uncharacterized membrane protein YwzB